MKEKILKIILKLIWFKKSLLCLRPVNDITQFFVIEFVLSAVLSLTDYLKQKSILHKPGPDVYSIFCILTFCNQAVPDQIMTCSKCVTQAGLRPAFSSCIPP